MHSIKTSWLHAARETALSIDDMDEGTKKRAMLMYGHLVAFVEGRIGRIDYEFDENRNGYAAWQPLLNEMEPVYRNRGLVLLEVLTNVENWPKAGSFLDQLRGVRAAKRDV